MRRFVFTLCALLLSVAGYANFGLEANLGIMPLDISGDSLGDHSDDATIYGASLFLERETENSAYGIKLGIQETEYFSYGVNYWWSWDYWYRQYDAWANEIPLTVYYKYKVSSWFHVMAGLGATYIKIQSDQGHFDNKNDLFPHLEFQAEFFPLSWWSIGANLKINMADELEITTHDTYYADPVYFDVSGGQFGLFTKIYF